MEGEGGTMLKSHLSRPIRFVTVCLTKSLLLKASYLCKVQHKLHRVFNQTLATASSGVSQNNVVHQ